VKEIKLIASDLDGTLIPEGTQNIEAGFTDVLQQLLDRGITFYAASGRPYASMKNVLGDFVDRIGFICENGALVMENREIALVKTFPADLARAVADDLIANPHTDILLSGTFCGYIAPKTEWFSDNMKNQIKNNVAVVKSFAEVPEPVIKIASYVYDFEQNAAKIRRNLSEKYGAYADFVYAGNGWIDMILKDTGKGFALKEIMERKNIEPDEVMTFGDNENDISMLALTPNSYAKSNSAAHVKECAAHECDSVTEVLKKYLECEIII
jgi:hypothetical protein